MNRPFPSPLLPRFSVYDADAFSPARFFFPRRAGASLNGTAYSTASAAGRYQLPADMSGLQGMASMMHRLQEMSNAFVSTSWEFDKCCIKQGLESSALPGVVLPTSSSDHPGAPSSLRDLRFLPKAFVRLRWNSGE